MKNTKPTGRTLDMTKGSPMKLLFTFALPLFLGNLLQQFYNLADTSIAGHLLGGPGPDRSHLGALQPHHKLCLRT